MNERHNEGQRRDDDSRRRDVAGPRESDDRVQGRDDRGGYGYGGPDDVNRGGSAPGYQGGWRGHGGREESGPHPDTQRFNRDYTRREEQWTGEVGYGYGRDAQRGGYGEGNQDWRGYRQGWSGGAGQAYGSQGWTGQRAGERSGAEGAPDDEHAGDPEYHRYVNEHLSRHDRSYNAWRGEQAKKLSSEYGKYRKEQQDKWSKDFETWRSSQSAKSGDDATENTNRDKAASGRKSN